jgi:hypothetical protein
MDFRLRFFVTVAFLFNLDYLAMLGLLKYFLTVLVLMLR